MALADALTAYAEFVGDTLVNLCGEPVPDRVLRYHNGPVPDEIECSRNGILSVWWDAPIYAGKCGQPLVVTLGARWSVCWPVPEATPNGVVLADDEWDAQAGRFANVAECVGRALTALGCSDVPPTDKGAAFLAHVISGNLRLSAIRGHGPLGGVAGVGWTVDFPLRSA